MAPVTKRRKRFVESDDEDDEVSFSENSHTRFFAASPRASVSPAKRITRATVKSKPELSLDSSPQSAKPPATKKTKTRQASRSNDILTLFTLQSQQAPPKPISKTEPPGTTTTLVKRPRNVPLAEQAVESISDIDQLIDDLSDIDDIDDLSDSTPAPTSIVGKNASKRLAQSTNSKPKPTSGTLVSTQSSITSFTVSGSRGGSQFLRPPIVTNIQPKKPIENLDDDLRPWSERFAPINLGELAVHKKKVSDVRRWLTDALTGRIRQRLLLLKGHAGTGKTTTVRLLSQDMGFRILEWKNPVGGLFGNMESASSQFESFLGIGGTFASLDTDESETLISSGSAFDADDHSKRIILIEEFPNTYTRSSSTLTSFRNTVLGFLDANTPSLRAFAEGRVKKPIVPIVMVISETLLTTTSAAADSFTAHRLLGPDILRHPGTVVVEFNAIAPSILYKALELIVCKEACKSNRKRTPGPQVLKRLGETGDIRNAVSSLEFLCLKGDINGDWGARVQLTKPKKVIKDISMTTSEMEILEQVSLREATLGIFHAVGKVIYNKRDDTPLKDNPAEDLPPYLAAHSRPKKSQVDVEALIDEIGTDTSTFVSALHENYPLSCEPPIVTECLPTAASYINNCIDALSDSDMLFPSWDSFFGGRGTFGGSLNRDTGSYVLRQDEMSFQVAVRGLLHGLPVPVKRQQHPGRRGGDTFKMFYPTSIKLWRTREEFASMLDLWSSKLLRGDKRPAQPQFLTGANLFRKTSRSQSATLTQPTTQPATSNHAPPLLSLGSAARTELVLERLPAMANILRGQRAWLDPSSVPTVRFKDLERVVSFRGIGAQSEEVEEQEEEASTEQWATDKPVEEMAKRKRVGIKKEPVVEEEIMRGVGGLVFGPSDEADEDIEDDVED